jgi:hypothetical protein
VVCVPLCVRVSRVSRVCPGSPRCLFTGVCWWWVWMVVSFLNRSCSQGALEGVAKTVALRVAVPTRLFDAIVAAHA